MKKQAEQLVKGDVVMLNGSPRIVTGRPVYAMTEHGSPLDDMNVVLVKTREFGTYALQYDDDVEVVRQAGEGWAIVVYEEDQPRWYWTGSTYGYNGWTYARSRVHIYRDRVAAEKSWANAVKRWLGAKGIPHHVKDLTPKVVKLGE